jgi:precorrin-4/cobalt-precorrin-4 C11-methyltransferase
MSKKIFFIGCGPGDRKLITVKGEEVLKKTDIVFYFPPYEKVFEDLMEKKTKYFFFDHSFKEIISIIEENRDKTISFLVPGDLSVFSPFPSFLNYLENRIEVIPGVGTFSYLAAKLKKILNPAGKIYTVSFLSTKMLEDKLGNYSLKELIHEKTTLIIYMNNLSIDKLTEKLLEVYTCETPVYIGINLCMEDEKVYSGNLGNISKILTVNMETEKFATVIVGDIENMPLNISWWDEKVASYGNMRQKQV